MKRGRSPPDSPRHKQDTYMDTLERCALHPHKNACSMHGHTCAAKKKKRIKLRMKRTPTAAPSTSWLRITTHHRNDGVSLLQISPAMLAGWRPWSFAARGAWCTDGTPATVGRGAGRRRCALGCAGCVGGSVGVAALGGMANMLD